MKRLFKQRIVGITVLIALAAIVIPYFISNPSSDMQIAAYDFKPPRKPEIHQIKKAEHSLQSNQEHHYVVQLASFSHLSNASALVNQLETKGFAAYLSREELNGTTVVRVLVGPEGNREAALKLRERLETELKLKGILVTA